MPPEHSMAWIAGWFPLLTIVISFALYYWNKRAWLPTILVFGSAFAAMWFIFTMHFWPWLLLYVFLCWVACWAANMIKSKQLFPNSR